MHREPSETSTQFKSNRSPRTTPPSQYGIFHLQLEGDQPDLEQPQLLRSASPQSVLSAGDRGSSPNALRAVNADQLEAKLRGLRVHDDRPKAPGQRVAEYEKALTPSTPRQALGFKVIKRFDTRLDGTQLEDFPNEILTHILSHLHPDSHAAVALVSKRFYTLVTTPHAWRMAFQRYFPGQGSAASGKETSSLNQDDSEFVRSEVRRFTRLTAQASWRSEYLLRTRLLRSLVRGKPGNSSGIGASSRTSQTGKKAAAVLTYNTKLPSMVTCAHATFGSSNKKPPRVIHGAGHVCVASASDPTNGRVEKWGLDDPFAFAQLDEIVPHLLPYGLGEGPTAVPNTMDVSQPFGVVGGEGFPGGRVFYRASGEFRGKYLGQEVSVIEAHPDIPKIPELSEGICAVWIAKSSAVPSLTHSMIGILTGSTLGIVTAYALGHDPSGPRYAAGEITARWVLSPGVPIISIAVDECYTQKRKSLGRVWAVALNALGEVYYLTETPTPPSSKTKVENTTRAAWHAGRTAYWQVVESTRRQARPDELGKNVVRGGYSPRSPSDAMNLTKEQMVAEAREIEKYLRYKPSHFRKVCYGWDMRRKLEVDFAGSDTHVAGESIIVIDCALDEDTAPGIRRLTRKSTDMTHPGLTPKPEGTPSGEGLAPRSLFGGDKPRSRSQSPKNTASPLLKQALTASGAMSPDAQFPTALHGLDEWQETVFALGDHSSCQISASAIDLSLYGLVASFEDPLLDGSASSTSSGPSDIPGRRARMFAVGTNTGHVLLWDMRETHVTAGVPTARLIKTDSSEVTCLAITALYLVHGGSDGLVQAWDPLVSTLEPLRTINSRSPGRVPRHWVNVNPGLRDANFSAVGAIFLDPDPTQLRGILCFGTFVRYWAYSSTGQPAGRKRRLRHSGGSDSRLASRRLGGGVKGYIAAEAEELRRDQEFKSREQARLSSRFGVGFGDLTEEEAIRYAEIMSQESYLQDEQRRTSASDTGSTADFDTTSNAGSLDTVTPDPSVAGLSPPAAGISSISNLTDEESNYELQIQQAIRLSLMEGVNDLGQSPRGNSSGEYDFVVKEKKSKRASKSPSPSHTPVVQSGGPASSLPVTPGGDEDLAFALRLSLAEEDRRQHLSSPNLGLAMAEDEFPALHYVGKGKAKVNSNDSK